ncbi:MAG: type II toxin-antitoxin system Phd/YefM family antitoxin [Lachnospiraceae bacterium]|nr:type II toxin-antitoxin system Phd/YefM family antitoxin [Lachnospiraceae bacterium]
MELSATFLSRLIPITQFNRGQASRIFDRLRSEPELVVLKNNQPSAVILSPDEYTRLAEIEENYMLLLEATKRLAANEGKSAIPETDVMRHLGITDADLEEVEDLEIE